jgi:hypothetical protein
MVASLTWLPPPASGLIGYDNRIGWSVDLLFKRVNTQTWKEVLQKLLLDTDW